MLAWPPKHGCLTWTFVQASLWSSLQSASSQSGRIFRDSAADSHVPELVTKSFTSTDGMLIRRTLKVSPLHHTDLDKAVLGKSAAQRPQDVQAEIQAVQNELKWLNGTDPDPVAYVGSMMKMTSPLPILLAAFLKGSWEDPEKGVFAGFLTAIPWILTSEHLIEVGEAREEARDEKTWQKQLRLEELQQQQARLDLQ
eukprot:gnl/TRDRNA2_/TRDRNA2_137520_c0_seq1.p1 gnl/TRDRNA2_/TRDRNA2_137520_c0~~gnl/TRDRNA2_/TRDRNA2_137520_c0_seq1.p1  ORF type:complete len:197 (+),score=25.35 gnl/TRDRNA2_/TRDRNA2_137520_c0_seq1:83-673(+)